MKSWDAEEWVVFLLLGTLFCACWTDCITTRVVYFDCLKAHKPAECEGLRP